MAHMLTHLCLFLATFVVASVALKTPLRVGFYRKTCPSVEDIVRSSVDQAYANDSGIAPPLIRLHFHDCFVRGCDASILVDSTPGNVAEKDSPTNFGVQGFEFIDYVKSKVEAICPNKVSCADIIAFAARDSVVSAGGRHYSVPGGRRDGTVSRASEPGKNLPSSFFNVTQLKENFASKGLSLQEMVTLSGAHSIGDSHCSGFSKRLYSFNATSPQDPALDPAYASYLRSKCPPPFKSGADPVMPFDPTTPNTLDNKYYLNLEKHKGLLFSDQVLWTTSSTKKMVNKNADHENVWAHKFAEAMVHMGSIQVLTGNEGQIRKNCRVVN